MAGLPRFLLVCAAFLAVPGVVAAAEAIAVSPLEGPAGQSVTVTGGGWQADAGDAVVIFITAPPTASNSEIEVASAFPDANGDFSVSFIIPNDELEGVQTITAIGNTFARASTSFTVTAAQSQQLPPEITRVETFQEGDLVFFRAFFTDPNDDAEGFGFRGALWAEESHPFSSPSHGRVSPGIIEYPFNHLCDTGPAYESDVEVWIYDSAGLRSPSTTVHLACSGNPPSPDEPPDEPPPDEPPHANQPPVIKLRGDNPLQLTQGCPFADPGATAKDPEDGKLTKSIKVTGTVQTNKPGTYTLTYSVADSGGLSDATTRQVVVFGAIGQPVCDPGNPPFPDTPEGNANNLIVLVHGCCTDTLTEWYELATTINDAIHDSHTERQWELVVWDWRVCAPDNSQCTPIPEPNNPLQLKEYADIAYKYASAPDKTDSSRHSEGVRLADAIAKYPRKYKYIHLIGHSAGAKLIDVAAKQLAQKAKDTQLRTDAFLHLTFLDAYAKKADRTGKQSYGALPKNPQKLAHFAEHYVDRTYSDVADWVAKTNGILEDPFNVDITLCESDKPKVEKRDGGHQWPRFWYKNTVTETDFEYGYPLSREGGNNIRTLIEDDAYRPGSTVTLQKKDCQS